MNIPGVNLLALAQSVIGTQTVTYYRFTGRTNNTIGQFVSSFAEPVEIQGSFQPVSRQKYAEYGLDVTRNYAWFYSTTPIADVNRDRAGDQLVFDGKRFEVSGANDWSAIDGWNGVLVVQVSNP
jgi:hypothetical protein